MIRDPFYKDIISRLNAKLDPELFEQCAADVLRNIYPGLVPIRGGNDAGMDGAIGDAQGNAYPLVSTTQKNVIGNLTKNLKSYIRSGGTRRNVIVATSQSLTPRKRLHLEKRASQLGFTLIQIHPQEAFADLLYRNPPWCKELLNLSVKCQLVDSIVLPIFAGYLAIPLLMDVHSSRLTFDVLALPMVVSNNDFSAIESLA